MNFVDFRNNFSNFLIDYGYMGNITNGGADLDMVINSLKYDEEYPSLMIVPEANFLPLMIDINLYAHPVFKEDCDIVDPYCDDYSYMPMRLELSYFDKYPIQIAIFDQNLRLTICSLVYRQKFLSPDYWEVCDFLTVPRTNVPDFIALTKRIREATLEDLFDYEEPPL